MKDTSTNQSRIDPPLIDDIVVEILAPYEYVALAMMSGTEQHPLPIRKPSYNAYMKRHNKAKALITERLIEELESIRKAVVISETQDDEFPYWCETCHMMLQEKDDLCGCEYAIRDRLATLRQELKSTLKDTLGEK